MHEVPWSLKGMAAGKGQQMSSNEDQAGNHELSCYSSADDLMTFCDISAAMHLSIPRQLVILVLHVSSSLATLSSQ